jgi:hypothetical protein
LEPIQEIVGREFSDPPLAGIAGFQVLAHRLGRTIIELAQAIGLQNLVRRVDGSGGAHCTISSSESKADCRSITNRERPQQRGKCRENSELSQTVTGLSP